MGEMELGGDAGSLSMTIDVTQGPKRKGNCQTVIIRNDMVKLKLEKPRVHVLTTKRSGPLPSKMDSWSEKK